MKLIKKAFTLVELIVVITILAILGTIGFISLQNYTTYARDGVRLTDIKSMKSVLAFYYTKNGYYPAPDKSEAITFSGTTVWDQGTFGSGVLKSIRDLSKVPTDPLLGNEYTYSLLSTRKEYELGAALEGGKIALSGGNEAYAAGNNLNMFSYIAGTYNGQAIKTNAGGIDYILAVPTIINGDITGNLTLENIIPNYRLSLDKQSNLPHSYGADNPNDIVALDVTKLVAWSGSISTLQNTQSEQLTMIENLQQAYTGTVSINNERLATLFSTSVDINAPSSEAVQFASILTEIISGNSNVPISNEGGGSEIVTGWRSLDSNCQIDDIEIGNGQVWAGCNSTLGDGFEWGKKSNGTDGNIATCYNYDGLNIASNSVCAIGSSNMTSSTSAKIFFDLMQTDGINNNEDHEYDTIWGKLYTWSDSPTACPIGWHVPSNAEWATLEDYLAGAICRTGNGRRCEGLGWNSEKQAKTRSLANILLLPLAGNRGSDGATFNFRGRTASLWSSTPSNSNAYNRDLIFSRPEVYRGSYGQERGYSVRCIKD